MSEMKKYGPSRVVTMRVSRVNEVGAFLDAETGSTSDDILLHASQQTSPVKEGDSVEVFLYLDPKRRLTASMRTPKLKEGQIARMKVMNVIRDGAFLDVGAERGIFLPFAGMRGRPQVGETVWAKLYTDKSGRLAVTMEVEDELRRSSKPAAGVKVGDKLHGSVYNINESGAFLFTDERYIVHIAHKEMPVRPKVGEEATVRITYIREDGRLNGSFREIKEKAILTDAENILKILKERGKMPYDDKTSPEIISRKFQISKAAFKRALGHLLKEGHIEMRDGWTYIKENRQERNSLG
ncbi:S1-like domain-containing RNA-binding protein [Selenomonas sp. TAMA-11512]|uniref:CvfB family protein n=1 Tax=Selenomonas sp. TAMA-11512 TaxID=3095337 RepID=UPI00308C4C2A|nr:S1-like domain-containing RNA-binding protein [Selenomonas sp. TAMA-11512]